jgi:hypothetical protein
MTYEQLNAAARKLCEIRCIDPDRRGYAPSHGPADVLFVETAADAAEREILAFYQVAQALDSVFNKGLK